MVPKGSLFNDFVDEYKRLKKDSTAYRENLKADLKNQQANIAKIQEDLSKIATSIGEIQQSL